MLTPLKTRVIGQLVGVTKHSGLIWTPEEDRGQRKLLRITAVGEDVRDVAVGDVVVLPDRWSGAVLTVLDTETNESEEHFVIDEMHLLAKIVEEPDAV